jgi:type IV secretion system protein VirB9
VPGFPQCLLPASCFPHRRSPAARHPPPEISYDDAAPAVIAADPPKPVQVVELPKPLPLPGQLKPVGKDGKPTPEPPIRRARQPGQCRRADAAGARRLHQLDAGLSLRRWRALSGLCLAGADHRHRVPARRAARRLRPVAAGDTVRWIIGDTESGTGASKQVHILVKPTRPN